MKRILFALMTLAPISSGADTMQLMNQLVTLRTELEELNREIESAQKERHGELDFWVQKKIELQSSLQKENLRRLQLDEKAARLAAKVQRAGATDPGAKRRFMEWVGRAEGWVNASLPFRREDRLETLAALRARAERGFETIESLSAELWQFYEAEFKMSTDNEYRIVSVNLPGGAQKAEVARLGLYTMFGLSTDNRLFQSVFKGPSAGWDFKFLTAESEKGDVQRLIENLKKKKDAGFYQLPGFVEGRETL